MNERLKSIIDLEKYPIHNLNSSIIKNLIKKCKKELDETSCSTIPNFILPKSLEIMNSELEKQLDEVYMSKENINAYLYSKDEQTKVYLGEKNHWRLVSESLVTFMLNKKLIDKYFKDLEKMGKVWEDPWEKPLHNIYKSHPCLSPIPSLAIHCTNINSVFGLSPFIDIKKLWENNRI